MRALIEAGYRVVDPGQQQRNAERNLLRGQDLNALPDLQTRLNADYLVTITWLRARLSPKSTAR